MLFIIDRLDKRTEQLISSLNQADIPLEKITIHYEGISDRSDWNPFLYYTHSTTLDGRPLFFNEINVPTFNEIRHINVSTANILNGDETIGKIRYYPGQERYVRQVDWLNKNGKKTISDCYSMKGLHYCTVNYDDKEKEISKIWINSQGEDCIWQNMRNQQILLKDKGMLYLFNNLTEFTLHFLEELYSKGLLTERKRCIINHLGTPLFIARRLNHVSTTIFWQESLNGELPKNMTDEIEFPTTIDGIVFDNQSNLKKALEAYPEKTKRKTQFYYLSPLEKFQRDSKYRKRAVTFTYSDQIHLIEEIASTLVEIQWTIAAPTDVSAKLRSYESKFNNITVMDWVTKETINELIETHDIYLDFNQGQQIDDCLHKAYLNQLIIFALEETAKDPRYELLLRNNVQSIESIKETIGSTCIWRQSLNGLRTKNGPISSVADYQRILLKNKT